MRRLGRDAATLLILATTLATGCRSRHSGAGTGVPSPTPGTAVTAAQFGPELAPAVQQRVQQLLTQVEPGLVVLPADAAASTLPAGSRVFSFGATSTGNALIPAADLAARGSEGFVVRSGALGGVNAIAAMGNPSTTDTFGLGGNIGESYGAYALLEHAGFAFLHPLQPISPSTLALPDAIDDAQSPYWPIRGIHLHTMHPLELTDLLNGWGPNGVADAEGWNAQLPEWDRFLEWMLANRQNRVEWVLLTADSWADFADSEDRHKRLETLINHAHSWGIAAGADAPIALKQQHTWRLVRQTGTLPDEVAQIHARLDWLMSAGYDFFSTETGSSEFTHPDPARMLAWMNEAAIYVDQTWHRTATIKVHTSTGQTADGYLDPETGAPLNFNFLPHYADARLGVMPHTVQMYSLDDPAPTYGNANFDEIRRFLQLEAGSREVLWHPETAYWVSYDVDVPLFLPLYPERRVHDLDLLAGDEIAGRMGRGAHAGSRMQGQMFFSSGWEFGYWVNDVVAARAAWNPQVEMGGAAFARALDAVVAPFGPQTESVRSILLQQADQQERLLVRGEVNGVAPSTIYKRTGQAYLQGWDAWDDIGAMITGIPNVPQIKTQPDKLGLIEMRNPFHDGPNYTNELAPLLAEMDDEFDQTATALEALVAGAPEHSRPLLAEIADASRMTSLRATQIRALYEYVGGENTETAGWRADRIAEARGARAKAAVIVARREAAFREPLARVAGWRKGPTAYDYGYVWTAHTLHYWWRDEGKALLRPVSPCYLNIVNPVDVAFGEGIFYDLAAGAADVATTLGAPAIADCLTAPATEPAYPPAGLAP